MKNNKCNNSQNKVLSEIYRRLNYFHKGNLDEPLMYLGRKTEANKIREFALITPYSTEQEKHLNWYKLTEKGKEYFKKYCHRITEETNYRIFTGEKVLEFTKPEASKQTIN